jgi:hypothetical protein
VAHVTLRCNVAGAEVVLRDRVLGTTPLTKDLRVTSGHAKLPVRAEGYLPLSRDVDLPGGGSVTIDADLAPKDASGVLIVKANVEGATVWLDGRPVGQVPVEVSAEQGDHVLRAERTGFDPATTHAVLAAGERKEVTLSLISPPPITAKWWFWTGIGVVVVGAAVTVVALTTERGPDTGTVSPGRASAPLLTW